jgi:hypothetical protein
MWWTITGNFGNILPIDWSKSYSKQMHVPTLKLGERPAETPDDEIQDLSSEDEAVAADLDLHQLILGGMQHNDNGPIQTAEEVIKEIDDIMDEQTPSEGDTLESEVMEKAKEVLGAPLYENSKCKLLLIPGNILRNLCRTQGNDNHAAQRHLHGDGDADPRVLRDTHLRVGTAR